MSPEALFEQAQLAGIAQQVAESEELIRFKHAQFFFEQVRTTYTRRSDPRSQEIFTDKKTAFEEATQELKQLIINLCQSAGLELLDWLEVTELAEEYYDRDDE